jgi:hypothetical protein
MSARLPSTGPIPVAERAGRGFIPVLFHPTCGAERYPRKAKLNADEAIAYARRVIAFRKIRTNEAKRRLAAISDPWWVEVVASMNVKPPLANVQGRVNRDRTGFEGWEC